MTFLIVILIILAVLWLARPWLQRKLQEMAMRRMENMMRNAMGMPPRDKQQKRTGRKSSADSGEAFYRRNNRRQAPADNDPIIPKEYAEDVEFTEYRSYSSDTVIAEDAADDSRIKIEEQVSDVEWEEIKGPGSGK